ncbi:MAG: hydroxylamine reductase [Planctomycetota bacterium]|nr:hydroxylamine reductase [Planctomycetota bacterium]MCX8040047.1 hydroxylamine reductase [Planctomycetota bacterium]MDW8373841.1 hydroxylamine reductase [Planctomycetota bacterium]
MSICNQCEQAHRCVGCTITAGSPGVCGKDEDIQSLQEILLYGLKGMSAYACHARRLGRSDPEVDAFVQQALFATMTNVNFDFDATLEWVLRCGAMNLRVMRMLDEAHTAAFGTPSPAEVQEGTQAGPGILITGHDLLDLQRLLEACAGTPVKVYTHGEMLPAHAYPKLRAHPNLAGHYGDAWQKQRSEFEAFPGAILATTNCVLIPKESYRERVFTTREVALPGARRITDEDYRPVVEAALRLPGCPQAPTRRTQVGFHHAAILAQAPAIIEAVRRGQISRFFVIGGCDGAEPGRNYFSEYAAATPPDSFILTLGCGKYRIRNHDYGTHLGLPRLLDMGQCNDAYGAIVVALKLAETFRCSVNELPLTLCLSWFEQKAVAVLLTLLHLGVKNIAIGPNPPAFVSPRVFALLQERFGLRVISGDPRRDVARALGRAA